MLGIAMWLALLAGSADGAFATTVRPILEQRCQPCHFSGGKMYARLPFDRPETIVKLGTKLFTRIKDEKEREVIRKFLASTSLKSPHHKDAKDTKSVFVNFASLW